MPPPNPWLVVIFLVTLGACDSRSAERREARRFLGAYEALSVAKRTDDRRARLDALRELPLHREASAAARDACVEAHGALLDAEAQQESAQQLLENALEGLGGDPLKPSQIAPIRERIDRSEASLAAARKRFATCEEAVRDLSVRYAER